ncbi:MAG: RNA polymerase sigma factor [Myxococcota bacterium]|nr:sigma-70 family RNA polymerase sigma factor [Myxococcota bacterium]
MNLDDTTQETADPRSTEALKVLDIDVVFREQARFVAWVALRILGRDEEVDDVVQEVFLSAMAGLKTLREPAAVKAWLKTVTVRTARRRLYKRRLKMVFRLDDRPDAAELASADASPEDQATLRAVYAILDRIPVEQRLAWTLRHVDGESLPAVAALVGCSLATVKRRIAAAQERLDKELRP